MGRHRAASPGSAGAGRERRENTSQRTRTTPDEATPTACQRRDRYPSPANAAAKKASISKNTPPARDTTPVIAHHSSVAEYCDKCQHGHHAGISATQPGDLKDATGRAQKMVQCH
jgi:hypothetical protein